ncbi:hypothetical protein [Mucilaginibacter aquariorum]|uniref:Outer membrane protein beta-barrel domain-containing protein n=1 Tax=Mucilaginibacter aquariorum TaxID=2967225 RepID=A0ABT1T1B0_9SPHI|nr:hypothetical protein [Mucilaginibacter aquariorum]MCQ6958396.1 hypothetical protein [Mucilaginibacter aquariorum]
MRNLSNLISKDAGGVFFKLLLCFLFLNVATPARAQLEVYGKFRAGGAFEPVIDYNGTKLINDKFSIIYFGLIRKTWGQALISLSYSPTKKISVSAGMGIEHASNSPRYTASFFTRSDRTTFLLLGELGSGNSNYLYKMNLFHQYTDQFTFGATAWRYHGLGPNFRWLVPKLQTTLWAMPAYDIDARYGRLMLGVSLKI